MSDKREHTISYHPIEDAAKLRDASGDLESFVREVWARLCAAAQSRDLSQDERAVLVQNLDDVADNRDRDGSLP